MIEISRTTQTYIVMSSEDVKKAIVAYLESPDNAVITLSESGAIVEFSKHYGPNIIGGPNYDSVQR